MFSKGDVVVINFPFSDLLQSKKRPALILANKNEDYIICAITSNLETEGIDIIDFEEGNLPFRSKIKYWQIQTIVKDLIVKKVAKISKNNYNKIIEEIYKTIK